MHLARSRPIWVAHRGMPRQARENTLPSFKLALDAGADGIELDVHATREGIVVVHHDPTLGDGRVIAAMTLPELLASPGGADVPTLDAVCELVAGRSELFVEVKGEGIEAQVAAVLDRYAGRSAIHSFDHALIARLHGSGTRHRLGILLDEGDMRAPVELMRATGATDVWPHYSLATGAFVKQVRAEGGRVLVWTVNDLSVARALALRDVDGICTDDVTLFRRA